MRSFNSYSCGIHQIPSRPTPRGKFGNDFFQFYSVLSEEGARLAYLFCMANAKIENHSHAWRGTWDRPIKIDEDLYHPFTIARMTDHNVRGRDAPEKESAVPEKSSNEASPNDKSKKGISYRSSEVGSGEEYYFYKQNRELIEDARKKRK